MPIHALSEKLKSHLPKAIHSHHQTLVWVPDSDIRETGSGYHIEIEVPGTGEKESMMIQWLSPRTLIVTGTIERPVLDGSGQEMSGDKIWEGDGAGWAEETRKWNEVCPQPRHSLAIRSRWRTLTFSEQANIQGEELYRTLSHNSVPAASATYLLGERKVGPWMRSFTLPPDVNMKALKAELNNGLLQIHLPKREATGEKGVRIVVE